MLILGMYQSLPKLSFIAIDLKWDQDSPNKRV